MNEAIDPAAEDDRLKLALRGSNVGIWDFEMPDADLAHARLTEFNCWEPLGYAAPGAAGLNERTSLWHPEDAPKVRDAIERYLRGETGPEFQVEARVRHANGQYRWRLSRGVAVRDAGGRAIRFLGSIIDITDRKVAEASLRRSEERFRRSFDAAAAGMVHMDAEGRLLRVNDTFVGILDRPREELVGRKMCELVHPEDVGESLAHRAELMRGALRSYSLERRMVRKDGSPVWTTVTTSRLDEDAAGAGETVAIVVDVSARKALEEESRLAKRLAEEASRAKDDFLAHVSHEMRTPMNAILGMTELVLDGKLTAEQRLYLEGAASAARSLLGTIDDLLDVSKIEAGKMVLDLVPFSPRDLLGEVLRGLTVGALRKGLVLEGHVDPRVPDRLVGDSGRLRQVLVNMVSNAVKFTEVGVVVASVAVEAASGDGTVVVRFTIEDTGIGIPPEKHASIFRAFEQEDASVTRRFGGTGLGLTIAARLVDLMGGTIQLESVPGAGSRFTFSLELRGEAPPETAAAASENGSARPSRPAAADEVPVAGGPEVTPLQILIAEDNDLNAQLLSALLRRHGHQVRRVRTGGEAVRAAADPRVELLLLDLNMPEMDGFEVVRRVRDAERATRDRLAIVAVTARARAEDRARAYAEGMDGFLTKPIHVADLVATIGSVRAVARGRSSWLSPEVLLATCGADDAVLEELVAGVAAQLPEHLDRLERATSAGDAAALTDAAHVVGGMTAAFSAPIGAMAADLEDLASAGSVEDAGGAVGRLRRACTELLEVAPSLTVERLAAAGGP